MSHKILSPIQKIEYQGVSIYIKRDDLIDDLVNGNKFRKLIGTLNFLHSNEDSKILTFGGAYSNHIHAVAAAGEKFGFETVGIIRGEELNKSSSETLRFADEMGMQLKFISRSDYAQKDSIEFTKKLKLEFPHHFFLPEGGTCMFSDIGIDGMMNEILLQIIPDYVCCPVGTGGTVRGILASSAYKNKVIGFSAIKKPSQIKEHLFKKLGLQIENRFILTDEFVGGGYAKISEHDYNFVSSFEQKYQIPIEYIYSGKMFRGIFTMIERGFFKKTDKIVAIHTGGIQGKSFFEKIQSKKHSFVFHEQC
jgi:1-aminocyclopropane-1-carboxylate deaminase